MQALSLLGTAKDYSKRLLSQLSGREEFELAYDFARLKQSFAPIPNSNGQAEFVFLLAPGQHAGWVLEGMCRQIGKYCPGTVSYICMTERQLPKAPVYFFAHYLHYRYAVLRWPWIRKSRRVVLYTHPKEDQTISDGETKFLLNDCSRVVSMCSLFTKQLIKDGLPREQVATLIPGVDPDRFVSHQRTNGLVGFCSGYQNRKNPDCILELVRESSHRDFVLMGRDWERYHRFRELTSFSNFEYRPCVPDAEVPNFYSSLDVFVSPSFVEGGPMPLLESMMCNVVPVVSRTGFAADLIRDGENGFLFDVGTSAPTIAKQIERAYQLETDIRQTVAHLTEEHFSKQVQKHF